MRSTGCYLLVRLSAQCNKIRIGCEFQLWVEFSREDVNKEDGCLFFLVYILFYSLFYSLILLVFVVRTRVCSSYERSRIMIRT